LKIHPLPQLGTYEDPAHTTDLQAECHHSVLLRRMGKIKGEYTTALYRGQLAGQVLERLHEHVHPNAWTDVGVIDEHLGIGQANVEEMAKKEKRPVSDGCRNQIPTILKDVRARVQHYADRMQDYFSRCELIGCELPVYLEFDMELGGEGDEKFIVSSHLDLLFRDPQGQLRLWDFKYKNQDELFIIITDPETGKEQKYTFMSKEEDSPKMDYLGRNIQFGAYWLACVAGLVQLPEGSFSAPTRDSQSWHHFNEPPILGWVDLANFKPYARRATVAVDGVPTIFNKNDERPQCVLIKQWTESPDKEETIKEDIAATITLMRRGIFVKAPGPQRCGFCESREWCTSYHRDDNPEEEL
jgi:hypothetical protein